MKPMKLTTTFYHRALLAFTVGMFLSCAARVSQAQELDRSKRPPSGAPTALRVPAIQMRTLRNGIKVAVLEQHELPVVSVRVVVDAQALLDPPGKEGVASITSQMLAEGTTTRTADQLAEAFADLGNVVRPDGFTTVTANVDSSLALLADMLLHPAFPQASLDRIRQNSLAALKRSKDQPSYLARRVFVNAVWGAGHPYERTTTEQSLAAITRDDLVAFHGRYYRPQNVKVVVAGDVTPAVAAAKVEKALGKWPAGGFKSRYTIPPAKPMALGTVYLYDRPNSPQSVFVVGSTGPARNTPDYYAIDLMNTTLGGAFSSRLNLNLRETHSFTYGAGSGFSYRMTPQPGEFLASTSVATPKTDSALVELMKELRDIRGTRPMTPAELDFAKSSATKSLPLSFETVEQISGAGALVLREGLPLNYFNTLSARYRGVTVTQANAAAKKYIDPSKLAIVIVGDRKQIEPGLRAANVGPVVVVDENGKPVSSGTR
jgi:zinc protease